MVMVRVRKEHTMNECMVGPIPNYVLTVSGHIEGRASGGTSLRKCVLPRVMEEQKDDVNRPTEMKVRVKRGWMVHFLVYLRPLFPIAVCRMVVLLRKIKYLGTRWSVTNPNTKLQFGNKGY